MKRSIPILLSVILVLSQTVYALTDERITIDPVANIYLGRWQATAMIRNLAFTDVGAGHWAKEKIARSGALDMVKGDNNGRYYPDNRVSNQEALAFVMRVMGSENAAQQVAAALQASQPADSPLKTLWSLGYLNLAQQLGLITPAQYNNALAADQGSLAETAFRREDPATREQVAQWLYQALNLLNPNLFDATVPRQKIYTFSDFEQISADRIEAVEEITSANIMQGSGGRFYPKSALTRAEMAALLANMDAIYFAASGLAKNTGTVGAVLDGQYNATGSAGLGRQFYVRTGDGTVDILQYTVTSSSSPQSAALDAVVYKNGGVGGLTSLSEGDQIEYIVNPATSELYYVQVVNSAVTTKTVQGTLQSLDVDARTITIMDSTGKTYTYPLVEGLLSPDGIVLGEKTRAVSELPFGSRISLQLKNDVVDTLTYLGEPTVIAELRGVVTENNPEFGYISFVGNNGREQTKYYISGDLAVEKQPYYTSSDTVGYLSHVFPNFVYNPRTATAADIEPGDIVFVRTDPNDPDTIVSISASTNYMMRYGKIKTFTVDGNTAGLLIEYENKQTAWFDLASGIPMTKSGKMITAGSVMVGDWARILINQAIVEPGVVIETVKEITLEGGEEHFISNIVKGQLAGINTIQNQIIIQNAQTLGKSGWANYQNLAQYSLASNDIEYYQNDTRVTLDYVNKYLKRTDGEVYVALENNFTGERVKRITFRDSRDELLSADTVVNADGSGGFMITGLGGTIETDSGTIVRRHGRLVEGGNITPSDYAVVSLNGNNRAAVVDITDPPGTTGVAIVRGRVLSVDEGKSFKVQSMATLTDNRWAFSPVQREFTIDNQTLFIDSSGATSINDFIGYGTDSVIDRVYNIVVDGGRAARVIDSPYVTNSVRGLIYETTSGDIKLRNAEYLDNNTGRWSSISQVNATLTITLAANTIIVKENKTTNANGLVSGDFVRVMVSDLTAPPAAGASLDGVIVRVEK